MQETLSHNLALSHKISSLQESATLAITKRVRELKAQGKDIVGLTLGEPDFTTPGFIIEAAKQAMDQGYTHYPPVAGLPELREEIARKFQEQNGLPYQSENIMVSTGAKQSVYNAMYAIVNPGDEILLPAPYWVSYRDMAHLGGIKVKQIPCSKADGLKLTAEQLEKHISPQTRLLMFSSPNNPSGTMYTDVEFKALAEVLRRHPRVYVIADEIYEHISYDLPHLSFASYPEMLDRVITINGFSKGYAMTGWRLGYMGGPTEVIKLAEKLQGQITSGANIIAQKAGVAALKAGLEAPREMAADFRLRRDRLYQQLKEIDGLEPELPPGAFYFYPDLSHFFGKKSPSGRQINDIEELGLYLIEEGGVAFIPGTAFGTTDHLRISYAYAPDQIREAVSRFAEALQKLS